MPLKITPLTPAVGAEVCGVDLGAALDSSTVEEIYRALLDRLVLFFRGQVLVPHDLVRFGAQFGELDRPHPIYPPVEGFAEVVALENDGARPPDTNEWHTDLTFYRDPPFASILHAVDLPALGGDTLWASMYAAYDALPAGVVCQSIFHAPHSRIVHRRQRSLAALSLQPRQPAGVSGALLLVERGGGDVG